MNLTPRFLFRLFYTSFYTILNIVLLALLLITPADAIKQALDNHQIYNVFVIAGSYLLSVLLGILIYASRLYTNRSVLAAIPKTWIPVEKGDVSKSVRKMIIAGLERSAAIAWDARPHADQQPSTVVSGTAARSAIVRPAGPEEEEKKEEGQPLDKTQEGDHVVIIPPAIPIWGEISHDGWAAPTSPDLPNLEYATVILELPHLIEARAVSLAPPDLDSSSDPPLPDICAVDILQRPASMDLRDYITHLTSFSVIPAPSSSIASTFLVAYEYARFSANPLSEPQFRDLMKKFAEILRIMQPLNQAILSTLYSPPESDIDDDNGTSPSTPVTQRSRSAHYSFQSIIARNLSRSESEETIHTAPSRRARDRQISREFITAPGSPQRSRKRLSVSRSPSVNSFAQTRAPYVRAGISGGSTESLRSRGSGGSVIKLSRNIDQNGNGEGEGGLPYVITVPGSW